jgi:hypothetical protein
MLLHSMMAALLLDLALWKVMATRLSCTHS